MQETILFPTTMVTMVSMKIMVNRLVVIVVNDS
jgi:hypothetical protein